MPYHFVDSHCHLDFDAFNNDLNDVIACSKSAGINSFLIPGITQTQWVKLAQLSDEFKDIYFACGIHPWWIQDWLTEVGIINNCEGTVIFDTLSNAIKAFIQNKKCIGIGECGIDGNKDIPLSLQKEIFTVHCQLAKKFEKPLIIHSLKAHNDVITILKAMNNSRGGVIHAFSGSYEIAKTYWDMGYYLGVGAIITYERAKKTRDAIKKMPTKALLLETDAPDMPLSGKQGERNHPKNIVAIAKALADLKEMPLSNIANKTTENFHHLFQLNIAGSDRRMETDIETPPAL